jgi:hypothetical protein
MGQCMYRSTFSWLGTSWRWVVSFTPRPLYHRGKSPRYPLDRRLSGPQSRSERRREDKIVYPSGTRTRTPRSSSLPFTESEGSVWRWYKAEPDESNHLMLSSYLNLCPCSLFLSRFRVNFFRISHLSHTYYMFRPPQSLSVYHTNNIKEHKLWNSSLFSFL